MEVWKGTTGCWSSSTELSWLVTRPKYGVQFITWQRDYDGSGVCLGHCFSSEDYDAAKQDFAVRAGLVHEESLLELEQKEPDTPEYGGMSFC